MSQRGPLERVIQRRTVRWKLRIPSASQHDKYHRVIAGEPTAVEFPCAWVPVKDKNAGHPDIGGVALGGRMVYVSLSDLESEGLIPTSEFQPDRLLEDETGVVWGIVSVTPYDGRVTPWRANQSRFLVLEIERKAIRATTD